ncbi:MAG: preprotein translocase subunit SecE [Saprospiraceae bacterium]
MENIRLYIKESYNELVHHVTWPTWPELFSSAKLVIVATIIFALIIFLLDLVSKYLTTALYSL